MERSVKLTIFAATGGIGRQVLEQAIAAGHDVMAVVRNPKKLSRAVPSSVPTWERPTRQRSSRLSTVPTR
jgi:uncharacterized protein YbjT (DUF2867 family)